MKHINAMIREGDLEYLGINGRIYFIMFSIASEIIRIYTFRKTAWILE